MIEYTPNIKEVSISSLESFVNKFSSAWVGHEKIIPNIIEDFKINPINALEFGVDWGYSTLALSTFFKNVTGVDLFIGGNHGARSDNMLDIVTSTLSSAGNIKLVKQDFREYIKENNDYFDIIHIDIDHGFIPTYDCAEWSIHHSDIVILHDIITFPTVKEACVAIAEKYDRELLYYPPHHGLGILARKK